MVSAQTEWRSLPNRAWVRDLSTELFVALGPHGLKSTEAALATVGAGNDLSVAATGDDRLASRTQEGE